MLKKYKEAEGDFTTALTIDPQDGIGLLYRAFCRISLEDYTGAMADNDAAMKLLQADDPQRWLTYRIRGTIHQVRGTATRNADELRAALVDFTTALRL